jgi:putative endonuclease
MEVQYCIYVILCDDNSFYTGYTKNLDRRIRLHKNGRGARYTRIHKPKKLVYVEEFNSRREAMQREKKVKRLNHQQKLKLIKTKSKFARREKRNNQA